MTLPTDMGTMKYVDMGQVFGNYQESTADTRTMKWVAMGQPFYSQLAGSVTTAPPQPVVLVCT